MVDYEETLDRLYVDFVEDEIGTEKIEAVDMLSRISKISRVRPLPSKLKEMLAQHIVSNVPDVVKPAEAIDVKQVDKKALSIQEKNLILAKNAGAAGIAAPEALLKRVTKLITDIKLKKSIVTKRTDIIFVIDKKEFSIQQLQKLYPRKKK